MVGVWWDCGVRYGNGRHYFDIIPGPFLTDFYFSPQLRAIPRAPGDTLHIVLILIKNDAPARPRPITPPYSETFSYGLGTGADLPTVRGMYGRIPRNEGLFYGMLILHFFLHFFSSSFFGLVTRMTNSRGPSIGPWVA